MAELFLSFLMFILAGLGMALGVILGRAPIRSGCGAVARIEGGRIRCLFCRAECKRKVGSEQGHCRGRAQGDRDDPKP